MTFTLRQLQEEQRPWVRHNFGDRPPWMPLLGICEELGELLSASGPAEEDDAIGDVVIFIADYCSAMNFNLQEIWYTRSRRMDAKSIPFGNKLLITIAAVQHHHLKYNQKIRNGETHIDMIQMLLGQILAELDHVSGNELLEITERTWSRVKLRDWKKDPISAGKTP